MTEQLKIGEVEPYFPPSVDSTMLSAFASCPQRFFNEFSLRMAPVGISPHLHAGKCFAQALETVRRCVYGQGATLEEALAVALPEFLQGWGTYEPPEGSGAEMKDSIAMWGAVVAYFNYWHPTTDSLTPLMWGPNNEPALEFRFAIPTEILHPETGEPIFYSGRCDMVAEYKGMVAPVDEKTSKGIGPGWMRQWLLRGQFMGYVYAVRLHGYECSHAFARGIGILKTEYKFAETPIPFQQWLLEQWWEDVHEKLGRMVTMYERMMNDATDANSRHKFWPYDFADACNSYGGCSYRELCRSQNKPQWYSDFARRAWDPLSKDPSEGSTDLPLKSDGEVDDELLAQMGLGKGLKL